MKHLKTPGLTALILVAFMVIAASASANATMCSTDQNDGNNEHAPLTACPGGPAGSFVYSGKIKATVTYPPGAVFKATDADGTTRSTRTCTTSTGEGTVNGTTGTGSLTSFTFSTCSAPQCPSGVTATTTASASNPWPVTATTTEASKASGNGTVDVKNFTWQFDCNVFGLHAICRYENAEAQLDFDGSDTAPELSANTLLLMSEAGSSSLCGQHASWTATYRITRPASLWVT